MTDWYDSQECRDLTMEFVVEEVAKKPKRMAQIQAIASDHPDDLWGRADAVGVGSMIAMGVRSGAIDDRYAKIDPTLAAREIKKLIDAKRSADALVAAKTNLN